MGFRTMLQVRRVVGAVYIITRLLTSQYRVVEGGESRRVYLAPSLGEVVHGTRRAERGLGRVICRQRSDIWLGVFKSGPWTASDSGVGLRMCGDGSCFVKSLRITTSSA